MTNEEWEMKNRKCVFALVCLATVCLSLAPKVSAQTASPNGNADPLHQLNNSVRALVRRVTPSVVHLIVTGYGPVDSNRGSASLVLGKQQSVGSGVIIDPDGYIVTNAHVVRGARRVQVNVPAAATDDSPSGSLANGRGRTLEARIVGVDTDIDLALLKIEAKNLPAIRLADYNKLRQGEVVFAFGSPEGLQNSVTMGVVSSVARQTDPDSPLVFIQTDAPINRGNSGGPLVNVDGELVGLNTFILSEGGGSEGLGFAIPSATVAFAYPQLRRYGHVHRGEIGLAVQAITPSLAAGLKLPADWGVIVSDVTPGSPAEAAGLKVQDIIASIDGRSVDNLPSLATLLFMRRGGEKMKLGVQRGSEKLSFDVSVFERPHEFDRLADLVDPDKGLIAKLGIIGLEIDPKVAAMLPPLRVSSGVIVAAKAADPSVDTLLTAGDVIHAINGVQVETIAALRAALDHLAPNTSLVLQIERDGRLMFVSVDLD
jgi:serine protease Do